MKYRFLEKEHIHQLFSEVNQEWQALTGTTTIIDILGKVLTYWASGKAVETLGWMNEWKTEEGKRVQVPAEQRLAHLKPYFSEIKALDEVGYLQRLDQAYKAHAATLKEKADEGTDLHAMLEDAVRVFMAGKIPTSQDKRIMDFIKWSQENVKKFLWSELNCFSSLHFMGGIADAGAELNDGSIALIDFKSSKEAYFNQFVQCAAYGIQLEENGGYTPEGEKILTLEKPITKYIVFPFGGKELRPEVKTDTEELKRAFLGLVAVYRVKGQLGYNN